MSIEETRVREAVQRYVDGCAAADVDAVRESFDVDAVMWGFLEGEYTTMTGAEFAMNVVGSASPAGAEFTSEIHSVTIKGDVAHAVLDEQQFIGQNFRNFFGLIRRGDVWRIVSKVFTTV